MVFMHGIWIKRWQVVNHIKKCLITIYVFLRLVIKCRQIIYTGCDDYSRNEDYSFYLSCICRKGPVMEGVFWSKNTTMILLAF